MAKTNSGLLEFKDAQKVLIALDDATSEVKKAVVIDADGVETDIQGVQPTGKKEITSTAEVNVANYATAQVVDEDLVAGNIKKDVDILGVVGSYEAPASDFSTADVTIANGSGTTIPVIYIENVIEENALGEESPAGVINAVYNIGSTASIRMPLYKGGALWVIGDELLDYEISVSGSATKVASAIYYITGNCTITLSTPHA